jgi:hypothetical protein
VSTYFKDDEEMKYLVMRARKMTARLTNRELPKADELRQNFAGKGTELTPAQAEYLLRQVRIDRGLELPTEEEKKAKPEAKREVEVSLPKPAPLQKSSSGWGRK